MRILQVIDTLGPGGAEDVFVELATATISDPTHSCVAMVPGPGWIATALKTRGVAVEFAPFSGTFSLSYLRAIIGAVRAHRVDVIHAHLLGASLYATLAGLATGVPVIATFHGAVDIPPGVRFVRLKGAVLRRAARLVTVSAQLKEYLVRRLGVGAGEVSVVENGIDISRFLDAAPADLRAEYGIPVGSHVIGSVGNIRHAKAYEIGVRALHALRAAGVDAQWIVAGQPDESGELMSFLEGEAERLGIRRFIHFAGFVRSPERFLAAVDCFLLCSKSEGHPLALCQAMTAARPIVATRCGVEAFADDGADAWLVPVNDASAMAVALQAALSLPAEAARRAQNARRRAIRSFDIAAVFGRYLALYELALSVRR